MSERDTQFQGFANLLWDDLLAELDQRLGLTLRLTPTEQTMVKDVFAHRAYDLVYHDHMNIEHIDLDRLTLEEQVARIPDITSWPEQT